MLVEALKDPDAVVRRNAALALGARGGSEAVPVLVGMVVDGAGDVEAAEVLGALAEDPAWADRITGALVAELAAPRDAGVRMRLVQALAELPPAVAVDALRGAARDDDRNVARTASALADLLEARPEDGPRHRS